MEPDIRELTLEDVSSFKELRLEMLTKHPLHFGSSAEEEALFEESMWIARIDKQSTKTIGAFVDGILIGLCVLTMNPRKKMSHVGMINSFYVKRNFRKQGIAKAMLAYIEELALKVGIIRLHLTVMQLNEIAIQFYREAGFVESGTEVEMIFHEGNYYSLLLMSKLLRRSPC